MNVITNAARKPQTFPLGGAGLDSWANVWLVHKKWAQTGSRPYTGGRIMWDMHDANWIKRDPYGNGTVERNPNGIRDRSSSDVMAG